MANEITKTLLLKSSKAGAGVDSANGASPTKTYNQTGANSGKGTQSVSNAADSALVVPASVGTPRDLLVENLDATNYITLSTGTGGGFSAGSFSYVQPGDRVIIQPIGTVYAKANTAPCLVQATAVQT